MAQIRIHITDRLTMIQDMVNLYTEQKANRLSFLQVKLITQSLDLVELQEYYILQEDRVLAHEFKYFGFLNH